MSEPKKYWFPAKRFGWGWGFPVTWEGWLVMLVFIIMVVAGGYYFEPKGARVVGFFCYLIGLSLALTAVCYAKGEPPAWRWGKK